MSALWEACLEFSGRRFGRLTVITVAPSKRAPYYGRRWWCLCECGTWRQISQNVLVSGMTKSCGCLARGSTSVQRFSLKHWYLKKRFPKKADRYKYVTIKQVQKLIQEFNGTLYPKWGGFRWSKATRPELDDRWSKDLAHGRILRKCALANRRQHNVSNKKGVIQHFE